MENGVPRGVDGRDVDATAIIDDCVPLDNVTGGSAGHQDAHEEVVPGGVPLEDVIRGIEEVEADIVVCNSVLHYGVIRGIFQVDADVVVAGRVIHNGVVGGT